MATGARAPSGTAMPGRTAHVTPHPPVPRSRQAPGLPQSSRESHSLTPWKRTRNESAVRWRLPTGSGNAWPRGVELLLACRLSGRTTCPDLAVCRSGPLHDSASIECSRRTRADGPAHIFAMGNFLGAAPARSGPDRACRHWKHRNHCRWIGFDRVLAPSTFALTSALT
jgi:hypothetical protein